jgi:wobble nucleotide-excising tRNase
MCDRFVTEYMSLTTFSVVKLDGKILYFEIAATVRQIIEILLGVSQPVLVSDHRLDDCVRSPAETKDFPSSPCVHISNEAHPATHRPDDGRSMHL